MVFCGKPSKGCTHCRTRRIKCDQVSPACSQCLRAGKQCPGYRDQLSLMFRDENEKVVTKARVSRPRPDQQQRKRTSVTSSSAGSSSTSSPEPIVPDAFRDLQLQSREQDPTTSSKVVASRNESSVASQDEGIKFFFDHYVSSIDPLPSFETVESAIFPLLCRSESFANAVSSVGYAGLSNVTKDPSHMIVARRKYAASLRDITKALGDVKNSDLDATLKSVVLLAAFEIVNGSSKGIGVGSSWAVHIDGGAAILKLMGKGIGEPSLLPKRRGWIQFVFAVYIKALSGGETAPAAMREWCESCRENLQPTEIPAITLAHIAYKFTNLHATIKSNEFLDSEIILQDLSALNLELDEWHQSLPDLWRFEIVSAPPDLPFAFFGKTHRYQDIWVSRFLHNYRWMRILVNELLLMHLRRVDTNASEYESQRQKSSLMISTMAADICTGVSASISRPAPAMSGVFMILFPLSIAGSALEVSDELHLWVLNMLEFIGSQMGISQATSMVSMVQLQRQAFKDQNRTSRTIADLWVVDNFVVPPVNIEDTLISPPVD